LNYEALIERDLAAIPRVVREFSATHGSEEAWKAIAIVASAVRDRAIRPSCSLSSSLTARTRRVMAGLRLKSARSRDKSVPHKSQSICRMHH
jgi:hypothetical protein